MYDEHTLARMWSKVHRGEPDGCWLWHGSVDRHGYGAFLANGINTTAHRCIYQAIHGPLSPDFQVDHLCRNPMCCNPAHLEAVTPLENWRRSNSASAINARRTHCKHGHPFDDANTYYWGGRRSCRACNRVRAAEIAAKKRAAA